MRALLVTNPKATSTSPRMRDVITNALAHVAHIEVAHTDHRGHAIALGAQARQSDVDVVVVLGGDGTVNEVVNGLLSDGPGADIPAVATLPGGSANVVARTLGLSNDIIEATGQLIEALEQRRTRTISLGRVQSRWFVFTAGIGFDAGVVHQVELLRSGGRKASPFLYASTAVRAYLGPTARRPHIRIQLSDGEQLDDAFLCVVTNTTPWTYYKNTAVHLTPHATYEGGLDVFALGPAGPASIARLLWQVTRTEARPRGRRVSIRHDLQTLRITADRPIPLQVDGDFAGEFDDASFTSVPNALRMVC